MPARVLYRGGKWVLSRRFAPSVAATRPRSAPGYADTYLPAVEAYLGTGRVQKRFDRSARQPAVQDAFRLWNAINLGAWLEVSGVSVERFRGASRSTRLWRLGTRLCGLQQRRLCGRHDQAGCGRRPPMAPDVNFWIVALGINIGVSMRMYLSDEAAANAKNPVLNLIEWEGLRSTLVAKCEERTGRSRTGSTSICRGLTKRCSSRSDGADPAGERRANPSTCCIVELQHAGGLRRCA